MARDCGSFSTNEELAPRESSFCLTSSDGSRPLFEASPSWGFCDTKGTMLEIGCSSGKDPSEGIVGGIFPIGRKLIEPDLTVVSVVGTDPIYVRLPGNGPTETLVPGRGPSKGCFATWLISEDNGTTGFGMESATLVPSCDCRCTVVTLLPANGCVLLLLGSATTLSIVGTGIVALTLDTGKTVGVMFSSNTEWAPGAVFIIGTAEFVVEASDLSVDSVILVVIFVCVPGICVCVLGVRPAICWGYFAVEVWIPDGPDCFIIGELNRFSSTKYNETVYT